MAAVGSIAEKIGCFPQALHEWVKKVEVNSGKRGGVPAEISDKMKALDAGARTAPSQRDPSPRRPHISRRRSSAARFAMIAFIDDRREA
jgi:hypothetical protein